MLSKIIDNIFSNKRATPDDMNYCSTLNFKNRDKWLKSTLQKLQDGSTILDAGAGELGNKNYCNHLKYVSQDLCEYDGQGNNEGLHTDKWDTSKIDIVSDITKIPVNDDSFDTILCSEVFEHLPYPVEAIKEFSRIIKRDGKLIITAPFCSMTHFAPQHFYSGYNRYFYERVLSDHGFEVEECTPNGNYFSYISQELERVPRLVKDLNQNELKWYETVSYEIVLFLLNKLSKKTKGTEQMLCFGYHVVARKK